MNGSEKHTRKAEPKRHSNRRRRSQGGRPADPQEKPAPTEERGSRRAVAEKLIRLHEQSLEIRGLWEGVADSHSREIDKALDSYTEALSVLKENPEQYRDILNADADLPHDLEEFSVIEERIDTILSRGETLVALIKEFVNKESSHKREDAEPEPSDGASEGVGKNLVLSDLTPKEKIQRLKDKLGARAEEVLGPKALYELRVQKFAEKHDLAQDRAALLAAESAYKELLVDRYKRRGLVASKKEKAAEAAYYQASFAWRTKLTELAATLEDSTAEAGKTFGRSERKEALVFSKRDTILRTATLKADAKVEGLTERNKSLFGKAEQVLLSIPKGLSKGLTGGTDFLGAGMASAFHSTVAKGSLEHKALASKYGRGIRITAGAGVATALAIGATPVAASGAALTFLVYAARGVAGTAIGTFTAKAAGSIYRKTIASRTQSSLKTGTREAHAHVGAYRRFIEKFRGGNARKRAEHAAYVEAFSAIAAGGAVSALSSPVVHDLLDRIGVLETVERNSGNTPEQVTPTETPPEPQPEVPTEEAEPVRISSSSIEVGSGDGFNTLFANIDTSTVPGTSPVLEALRTLTPTELSEHVNAFSEGKSMVMHGNEELVLQQNPQTQEYEVWFVRPGEEPVRIMEAGPDGTVTYTELSGHEMRGPAQASPEGVIQPESDAETLAPPQEQDTVEEIDDEVVDAPQHPPVEERSIEDAVREMDSESPVPPYTEIPEQGSADRTVEDAVGELGGEHRAAPIDTYSDGESSRTVEDAVTEIERGGPVSYENAHGVEITPTVAAVYESEVPGSAARFTVVAGGDAESMTAAARAYAAENPGTTVYVEHSVRDPLTGAPTTRLDAWRAVPGAAAAVQEDVRIEEGQTRPNFDRNDFLRRMS